MKRAIVESHYCGSILYYHLLAKYDEVLVDGFEYFQKGSYRNRCYIFGANGRLRLSIPLARGKQQKRSMKDVLISNEYRWQQIHWQSLCSAYRTSPFFEYYEHQFEEIYQSTWTHLMEFNLALDSKLRDILKLNYQVKLTGEYFSDDHWKKQGTTVYRGQFNPRKPLVTNKHEFLFEEYYQVFANKMPFEPNLSSLDLIFNLGPGASEYLNNSIKLVQ